MSALEEIDVPVKTRRSSLKTVAPLPRPHAWPRGVFPILILGLLAAGMVGHLFLQTRIQEQAFELGSLQSQAGQMGAQQAILQAALDRQVAPRQLAWSAAQLGMVANPYATYLVLPSGQIVGSPTAVTGREVPAISAAPPMAAAGAPVDILDQAAQPVQPEAAPETPPGDTAPDAAADLPDAAGVQAEGHL